MKIENFRSYNLRKLLLYANTMVKLLGTHSKFRQLLSVVYNLFTTSYRLEYIKHGFANPILFINTSEVAREDMAQLWRDVKDTVVDQRYDELLVKHDRKISLKKMTTCAISLLCWVCILKKKCPQFDLLLSILYLEFFLDIVEEIDKLPHLEQYRLGVFFYDARPIDNLLSQYLQHKGIETATLQHGTMLSKRPSLCDNLDYCGVELESFASTYFLGWNDFTKNEAIKSGIPTKKIITLGCAKCINKQKVLNATSSKKIGLILDGVFEEENNMVMVDILNDFCSKEGFSYIARFHPSYPKEKIGELNIDSRFGVVCSKELTLENFMQSCALCIVSNSTVLFELEAMGYPFMRYSSNNAKDKYRDFDIPSFRNEAELRDLYHTGKGICISKGNGRMIYENYKNFFNNYLS